MSGPTDRCIRLSDFVTWRRFVTGKWYANPVTGQVFRTHDGTEVMFSKGKRGYQYTNARYAGMHIAILKHRAIWIAAHGLPPHNLTMTIDHINGDKTDNRIENLQLIPQDENGQKGCRKLRPEQVLEIKKKYAAGSVTYTALAGEYNVSREAVRLIIRGYSYKEVKEDDTE